MDQFVRNGYPYELAGLLYYAFFLVMSRGRNATRFSRRSKVLTLLTAMVLVGSVPLHYGGAPVAIAIIVVLAAVAAWSTLADQRRR